MLFSKIVNFYLEMSRCHTQMLSVNCLLLPETVTSVTYHLIRQETPQKEFSLFFNDYHKTVQLNIFENDFFSLYFF